MKADETTAENVVIEGGEVTGSRDINLELILEFLAGMAWID